MAGSVNKVLLIGNLGKDPEIRRTNEGSRVATFSMATGERWKDKITGEMKDRTEWHRVVVFNENLVDVIEKYVKKGSKVYIEGQLQTRKWTDAAGHEKYTTEVVLSRYRGELTLLDSREGSSMGTSVPSEADYGTFSSGRLGERDTGAFPSASPQPIIDDEIPF